MKWIFTTGQVASICRVAPRTVSQWFDSGRLKGYRIPGSLARRIPRKDLIEFMKKYGLPLGELEDEELQKVLLIGTESIFTEQLRELLPDAANIKYQFAFARSGFEAGELAQSFAPDTIIIDFVLGRGESTQIATHLRRNDAYTTTLIIGLAGEDEASPEKLTEYGFNEIYKKPFDASEIAERIQSLAFAAAAIDEEVVKRYRSKKTRGDCPEVAGPSTPGIERTLHYPEPIDRVARRGG